MSSIINKVKDAIHGDHHSTTSTTKTTTHSSGAPEGVAGPHDSRVANAADPRIDSDLDGRAAHTHGGLTGGTGASHGVTATHNHGLTGAGTTGTHNHGLTGAGTTGTGYGNTAGTGAGYGTAGPHSSNLANKVDPSVSSHSYGTGQTGTGVGNHALGGHGDSGGLSNSTNAGPHNSNVANKLDPRVDSDLDSTGNRHGASKGGLFGASGSHATAGSGTAQNTNGPHNSDTLNKLDPRVDADGDGSKTFGGNKTHA